VGTASWLKRSICVTVELQGHPLMMYMYTVSEETCSDHILTLKIKRRTGLMETHSNVIHLGRYTYHNKNLELLLQDCDSVAKSTLEHYTVKGTIKNKHLH